ncbi:hypothetical protein HAX54_019572, partial [Datura stramonium]|nr:hypothetical protein [Datura stramonium]
MDRDIPIILGRPFLATGRALMDSKKHEVIFCAKDESITFKAGRGRLLPIGVGDICVVNVEHDIGKVAEHAMTESSKERRLNHHSEAIHLWYQRHEV